MKKLFIFTALVMAIGFVQAQRYGIVDSKYILDKIPDYKDAQKKLDQFSAQWQK
jgi:outer membrane protein